MNTSERPRANGDLRVSLDGVSKRFSRRAGQSLLRQTLQAFVGSTGSSSFAALQGVSFQLHRGEGLAVVGRNGAGKSTLLSIVAGLCRPDAGKVEIRGRVGALLALGSGLHPDLSGRENLYLNAAMCGMTRDETKRAEADIIAFAELEAAIDEPLRTYSQGMSMRLAFSIAVFTEPDILIIDEVLAVGDARFQEKCRQRILELRDRGCTFLFVSHNSVDVLRFCQRAIWLEDGQVRQDGDCQAVLAAYQQDVPLG
jgi:ABC-type polysaccharide/polyol phosphate transport system ATPase subunit